MFYIDIIKEYFLNEKGIISGKEMYFDEKQNYCALFIIVGLV